MLSVPHAVETPYVRRPRRAQNQDIGARNISIKLMHIGFTPDGAGRIVRRIQHDQPGFGLIAAAIRSNGRAIVGAVPIATYR